MSGDTIVSALRGAAVGGGIALGGGSAFGGGGSIDESLALPESLPVAGGNMFFQALLWTVLASALLVFAVRFFKVYKCSKSV